ncbi:MAG TPA: family 20 glycosylhydrolase [Chthoniobacteraceae bacterium]|nr:family 20 glycosylhydrolase [Chthoniobacteraceae bacterium]
MSVLASLPLRVVQLDLARQMETPRFIGSFMDFAADNGFNAVALYLEARIRTASFPHPSLEESYSAEEISGMVSYAAAKGLEVIPVVSTLGHAQLFLRHAALEPLSETRPPFTGRFGPGEHKAFCPSQSETHAFLRGYLSEVAALFPSRYFHIGCDETWDMRRCDLCRPRPAGKLFSDHLKAMARIVHGELGKRMIVWDDMFFEFPEALEQLPRDTILACWQYQSQVDIPRGHFLHREAVDLLELYDRMGFDYLICPADYSLDNAASFTAYAARHRPLGGWLTLWEKQEMTPLQSLPLVGAVGRMWSAWPSADAGRALQEASRHLFGLDDPLFDQALRTFCRGGYDKERNSTTGAFLTLCHDSPDPTREETVRLLLMLLAQFRNQVSPPSLPVLDEIILSLESEQASHQLARIFPRLAMGLEKPPFTGLEEVKKQIATIRDRRLALHAAVRPGLSLHLVESLYARYLSELDALPELAASHGLLHVFFCLADQYSAQTTRFSLIYVGEPEPVAVAQGVFKAGKGFDAYYSRLFPTVDRERVPEAVLIETWGYGGQGFTWFEVVNARGRFIPEEVKVEQGSLTRPEWLLRHDWKASFAGEPDARVSFFDETASTAVHRFRVTLRPETSGSLT